MQNSGDLVKSVQDIISERLPGSGYVSDYRHEEVEYWSAALPWIDRMPQGISVLDVGCAYGTLALYARKRLNAKVLALDVLHQEAIARLLAEHGVEYGKCFPENEPLPDGRFDLIIFTEVIEHLDFHPVPTLKKFHAALNPGGHLILSTPDADSAWGRVYSFYPSLDQFPQPERGEKKFVGHTWQYNRSELESVLADAGFVVEQLTHSHREPYRHFNCLARKP